MPSCEENELALPSVDSESVICAKIQDEDAQDFCPTEFNAQAMPDVCFKIIDSQAFNHTEALAECSKYSADLLSVHSTDTVIEHLNLLNNDSRKYHIDGYKDLTLGEWTDWKENTLTWKEWANGQPNGTNATLAHEQCLYMTSNGIDDGLCTLRAGALCQLEVPEIGS